MSLATLYQQMILEHNKNPCHFCEVDPCTHYSHGHNPLCGDDYKITIRVVGGQIEAVGFTGQGCAISKASGSMMTQSIMGKSVNDSMVLKDQFLALLLTEDPPATTLGKLQVFEGVRQFPVRVKCATLVWRALEDALSQTVASHCVSTE